MTASLTVTEADLDTLARTLYGEARGEPLEGQQGVAWAVRNRLEWEGGPHWWGGSIAAICQHPWQFSCWNTSDPNRSKLAMLPAGSPEYQAMRAVAEAVCAGAVPDPTGGASHYERAGAAANWTNGRIPSATIGHHLFFRIGPG